MHQELVAAPHAAVRRYTLIAESGGVVDATSVERLKGLLANEVAHGRAWRARQDALAERIAADTQGGS